MIVKNEMEQWLGCTGCGERIELRRSTLADPERVLIMMERLKEDHAGCDGADSPRRAEVEREYRVRMRREFAKIQACGVA